MEHFAGILLIEKTAMCFQLDLNYVEGVEVREFYDIHRPGLYRRFKFDHVEIVYHQSLASREHRLVLIGSA